MLHRVLVLCTLCLLGACATQSPTISAEERPAANEAYIYGRFHIRTTAASFGLTHINIGFSIECSDGARYTMLFKRTDTLYAVRVKPAECAFKEILFLGTGSYVQSTKPIPAEIMKPQRFEAGRSYYLGDFEATAIYTESSRGWGVLEQTRWRIDSLRNNFVTTSKDFRAGFPALAALPTEPAVGQEFGNE